MHPSHDPQANTLRHFTLLADLHPAWPGRLILSVGLTPSGTDLALAANIAGAVCLSVDRSPEACRSALRSGAVDFVVNTLDEALRALKNEIRQRHPLSVALAAEPAPVLAEALDRGLLPHLFTAFAASASDPDRSAVAHAAQAFAALSALIVDFDGTPPPSPSAVAARDHLAAFTASRSLTLESFEFESGADLRTFDARVLTIIPPSDTRRPWVLAAPRHFSRSRPGEPRSHRRALLLTPPERDLLASTFHSETRP